MIPIAKVELGKEEIDAVVEVLKSGRLVYGEKIVQFEKKFAQKTGAKFVLSVSSGTAALHIAYLALIKPGDEVLVPAFSHISTASMICFSGGKPVFCDIDPKTFDLCNQIRCPRRKNRSEIETRHRKSDIIET